jgi:4-hydroxybutyrate dehydrogenase
VNFVLKMPKLVFGAGSSRSLGEELATLGATRPLFLSDRGLIACGVFERATSALRIGKLLVYEDVPENPTFEGVDQAAALYREERCNAVVAVGGGSVIDTAKMVAVLAGHSGSAADYVGHSEKITGTTAPLIVLPTTAGTGSEASPDAGIHPTRNTRASGITSLHVIPRVAICDPDLTMTMPPRLTACTALDALSHCIEGYLSTTDMPLIDAMALDGVRRVWRYIELATTDGQDREARTQLMLGAFYGGVAIGKGLGPAHAIAITVGDQGLHHGMLSGLGVVAAIATMHKYVPDRVDDLAGAMGLGGGEEIEASLRQLLGRLDLPASLREMGYRPGDLNELAHAAAGSHFNVTSRYRPNEAEYARMLQNILA